MCDSPEKKGCETWQTLLLPSPPQSKGAYRDLGDRLNRRGELDLFLIGCGG